MEHQEDKPFRRFEARWAEKLGRKECPFLVRWVITLWEKSARLHHWLGSDDMRFFHDHGWDFLVIVLFGGYWELLPAEDGSIDVSKCRRIWRGPGSITFYPAEHRHAVNVPQGKTAWSLVFSGKIRRKHGYWLPGRDKVMRHRRYFSRYGLHPCDGDAQLQQVSTGEPRVMQRSEYGWFKRRPDPAIPLGRDSRQDPWKTKNSKSTT